MADRWVAEAPAKVNLWLRVRARRADGYHELDTVFQAIDLHDRLEFELADGFSCETDVAELRDDEHNLALRAARMLHERYSPRDAVHIRLEKHIPIRGGLGGGSSDAAATLLACARLWRLEATRETLAELGRGLGADVPFFLYGGTARGRARGDEIEPLRAFGARPLLLGVPPFGISTAEVFRNASKRLTLPVDSVSFPALFGRNEKIRKDLSPLVNDLEEVALEGREELRSFRDALLEHGAERAMLSGSGSTVFAIFSAEERRDAAWAALRTRFDDWNVLPSRTLDEGVRLTEG